jgi:hypothetical protein
MCFVVLSACSQSVPKCGDDQVTTLVKEIANREMGKQVGAETAKMFSYDIQAIRTTNTNMKTGAHECSAELKVETKNAKMSSIMHSLDLSSYPITYTVEKTDDSAHIYVNVFGLR